MEQDKSIKKVNEGIGDDTSRHTLASPFSHHKYLNDVTKLKHIGHVSSDKQKNSPLSAGARGLGRMHDFAFKRPNQMMKGNQGKWRQNTLEDIKVILTRLDTLNK
tara:strand:- start:239 stop:553 length:315 start_codon:yes stop_codon:yes gene_type:complete